MSAPKSKKMRVKEPETDCPNCGLQYGGKMAMRLNEASINGRVAPNICMCGMRYMGGHWFKEINGTLYMMVNKRLYKVRRM